MDVTIPATTKPVSNAQINRELAVLRRAFRLAAEHAGLKHKPAIRMLTESEPRSGFFTRSQVDAVCTHLPPEIAAVTKFAFMTAWRLREVLGLEWSHVDFSGRGKVWIDGARTKNGKRREFAMTVELRTLLEERQKAQVKLKATNRIVPYVFHRETLVRQADGSWKMEPGQPIKSFRTAWSKRV